MSLIERDYMKEKYAEKNKLHNKKWNNGFGSKKSLESELDRICEDKRKQKEYKKQLFNQNIKPHIVYMDENGNISKKVNSHFSNEDKKTFMQLQKKSTNKYVRNMIIKTLIILITLFFIFYLSYDLYMSSTMIF